MWCGEVDWFEATYRRWRTIGCWSKVKPQPIHGDLLSVRWFGEGADDCNRKKSSFEMLRSMNRNDNSLKEVKI